MKISQGYVQLDMETPEQIDRFHKAFPDWGVEIHLGDSVTLPVLECLITAKYIDDGTVVAAASQELH
jgi:hypothetical protein